MKISKYKIYQHIPFYILLVTFLLVVIYISAPYFLNYSNYKKNIETEFSKNFALQANIKGEIKYQLFPTPRLLIQNVIVNDLGNENINFASIGRIYFKIPFSNLYNVKHINFSDIDITNADIKIYYQNFNSYIKYFNKDIINKIIQIKNSTVTFYDKSQVIHSIKNLKLNYFPSRTHNSLNIKGNFLNDKLFISYQEEKKTLNPKKKINLKLKNLGLNLKITLSNYEKDSKINLNANYLKNSFLGSLKYKNDKLEISNAKFSNEFINGDVSGEIKFLPFFVFNLNLDLNAMDFRKIIKKINLLDEKDQENLFRLNKKINGITNINIDKIYSKSNLLNSAESIISFKNGNIYIEKLIFNINNIGAADISGSIYNYDKITKFYFNNTINIDNLNKFNSKFNIRKKIQGQKSINLDAEVNLNAPNIKIDKIEVDEEAFNDENNKFVEMNVNSILFDKSYETLFNFANLKLFVQTILD